MTYVDIIRVVVIGVSVVILGLVEYRDWRGFSIARGMQREHKKLLRETAAREVNCEAEMLKKARRPTPRPKKVALPVARVVRR